jgi:hypothetical protein
MKGRGSTGGRHQPSTMSRTCLRWSGRARGGWSLPRQPYANRCTGYELTKSLSRESPDRQFRQLAGKVEVPFRPSTTGRQSTCVAAVT